MDGRKIVETYPKTTEKIINWIKEAHKSTGQPDIDQAIANVTPVAIAAMITMGSPRFLYDFFDKYRIFVCPYNFGTEGKFTWLPNVNATEIFDENEKVVRCNTREEAEEAGFYEAFKICEKHG